MKEKKRIKATERLSSSAEERERKRERERMNTKKNWKSRMDTNSLLVSEHFTLHIAVKPVPELFYLF